MSREVPFQTAPEAGDLGRIGGISRALDSIEVSGISGSSAFVVSCTDLASQTAEARCLRWARDAQAKALEEPHVNRFRRHLGCHRRRQRLPKIRDLKKADRRNAPGVQVRRSKLSDALYYAGLQTCGSPWICPHCAAKITERRREEIQQAVDLWLAAGNTVALGSLTNSHHAGESLKSLMDRQAKALAFFFKDRRVRKALKKAHVIGHIRAWEVTHGRFAFNHGWHPHFHILFFFDVAAASKAEDAGCRVTFAQTYFADLLRGPLALPWLDACQKAGLGAPSAERGVRVDPDRGGGSAKYPAKMGLEEQKRWHFSDELARGQTKKAADGKGETPFQLLDEALRDPANPQSGELWLEYATAVRGRAQVYFSRGLRQALGLGEAKSDAEVAAEVREDDPVWALLTPAQWRLILRNKAEFELLRTGETQGLDGVLRLLERLTHVSRAG